MRKYFVVLLFLIGCKNDSVNPNSSLLSISKPPELGFGIGSLGLTANGYGFAGWGTAPFGATPVNKSYKFDPQKNSWSPIATLPEPFRYESKGFVSGTNTYVIGGVSDIKPCCNGWKYYNDLWLYDQTNDQWQQKKDLPIDTIEVIKAVVMNVNGNGFLLCNNKFWLYNASSDTWESQLDLPFSTNGTFDNGNGIHDYSVTTSGSKGYVSIAKLLWEYNINTKAWKQLSYLDYQILFSINGKGYYAKDVTLSSGEDTTNLFEYDFATGQSVQKAGFQNNAQTGYASIELGFSIGNKGYFLTDYRGTLRSFYEFTP